MESAVSIMRALTEHALAVPVDTSDEVLELVDQLVESAWHSIAST